MDKHTDLISRLQDEADLCRNDGASDIAALLDEAVEALRDRNHDTASADPALTEGLGAVLTYEDNGGTGACRQTLGADGAGWFSVLFYGAPDDAHRSAGEYLRSLRAAGRRIKSECVVTNEQSYSGPNVRAVVVGA